MNYKAVWNKYVAKGHERTIKAKKNVLLALFLKGIGILIGFAYFPISLSYLSPEKFGIFLTLSSIIDWFSQLDVGIGNGLRNKFGEAVADGDDELAQGYVSTAYFIVGSVFSGFTLIFFAASWFLPWAKWLQAEASLNQEIAILAMLMFAAFAIRFVSSLVFQLFYAFQQTGKVQAFNTVTKVLFLVFILVIAYTTEESLILFGAAKTFTFAFVPLFVGFYYFSGTFKKYRPKLRLARMIHVRSLFGLGFQFFLIRMSMIVIHQTNNFLIAGFVNLESVTHFQAAYKYLSIFLMLFVILTNQLWGANIEAYKKGDMEWMRRTMRGVTKIWLFTVAIAVLMVAFSPIFYHLWLQDKIHIPFMLSVAVAISVSITNWVNMFNIVINGTGKIRLQMITWVSTAIVNIPVSILLVRFFHLGAVGIVMGTVICLIPLAIVSPLQVNKLLNKTDRGIWAK
ncbi:MAG: oligosaccharide flippase family protein [Phaeodactylibacter sp.]|nr:oligosaccharide flippase family protein [Phaeodactylibacter sp.]MCB9290585.1 oligosaccharide flippase family protein [Lewinellaceae bacterium]